MGRVPRSLFPHLNFARFKSHIEERSCKRCRERGAFHLIYIFQALFTISRETLFSSRNIAEVPGQRCRKTTILQFQTIHLYVFVISRDRAQYATTETATLLLHINSPILLIVLLLLFTIKIIIEQECSLHFKFKSGI